MMSLNNVEKVLSNVNISLRDSRDSFRDMEDVIADVASVWDTLTDVQKAQISNAIAGQRQAQIFSSLMQNWGDVTKYVAAETESLNLAEKNYAIYLESIEAKQNEVRASWEKLVSGTATAEFIGSFYEGATNVLEFIDAIGGIPTVLKIVIPLAIAFNAELLKTKILSAGDIFKGLIIGIQSLIPAFGGATVAAQGTTASLVAANIAALPFVATVGLLSAGLVYATSKSIEFADAQEEIRKALSSDYDDIAKTSSSYDDYVKKATEAAEAQGYFIKEGKTFHKGYHGIDVYVNGMDLLTEAVWKASNGFEEGGKKVARFTETIEESTESSFGATSAYKSLSETIKELTDSSSNLDDIMSKAEVGNLDFSDIEQLASVYPDYLDALSVENGQLKLNTDIVREYIISKAEQAVADAQAAGATNEEIAVLQAYVSQLQRAQYVMINGTQMTTGAFNQMAWSIAQDAAMSGNSFVDMQGKALNSAEAIYQYMASGNQGFNDFVRQIANVTGLTVEQVMSQINAMMVTTAQNAYALENSLRGMSGQAYGGGGNYDPLRYAIPNQPSGGGLGIFTPAPIGYQYPGGLSDYSNSMGGGSNSGLDGQVEADREIQEIENQINEARKDAIDDLMDQLDVYKDIIDARKEIIDTLADEREYQQDVENKNKEILRVQNELATLQLDTSEEGNARRLVLEEELANLTQELENIQYDQSVEEQKNALDVEYEALEDKINLAIRQIEGIQASSLSDFASQLSSILSALSLDIPEFHDGAKSGVVGKGMSMKNSEVFAKLMAGEVVSNPSQIDNFIEKTLPNIIEQASSNFVGGNIELSMPINVNGGVLDKTVLPDIEKLSNKLLDRLQDMMNQRGWNRRADLFQI